MWKTFIRKESQLMINVYKHQRGGKPGGQLWRTLYHRLCRCDHQQDRMRNLVSNNDMEIDPNGKLKFENDGGIFDRKGHAFAVDMSMEGFTVPSGCFRMHGKNDEGGVVDYQCSEKQWTYTVADGEQIPTIFMTLYLLDIKTGKMMQLSQRKQEPIQPPDDLDSDTQLTTWFCFPFYELIPEGLMQQFCIEAWVTLSENVQKDAEGNTEITRCRLQIHFQREDMQRLNDKEFDYSMWQLKATNELS